MTIFVFNETNRSVLPSASARSADQVHGQLDPAFSNFTRLLRAFLNVASTDARSSKFPL